MDRRSLEGFPSMCRCRRMVFRGHVCLVLFRAYLFSLLAASSCLHWMLLHSIVFTSHVAVDICLYAAMMMYGKLKSSCTINMHAALCVEHWRTLAQL